MLRAIEMGWFILDKYYALTDEAPVYTAALLLHPSRRLQYLKRNWPPLWHDAAVERAIRVWDQDYKNIVPSAEKDLVPPPSPILEREPTQLQRLKQRLQPKPTTSPDQDSFDAFINSEPIDIGSCTALEWWCQPEQRRRYPRLHRMAIDILSVAPESAEAERTFSGARRTIGWDRARLSCKTVELLECIGNWIRNGFIRAGSIIVHEATGKMTDEMEIDITG